MKQCCYGSFDIFTNLNQHPFSPPGTEPALPDHAGAELRSAADSAHVLQPAVPARLRLLRAARQGAAVGHQRGRRRVWHDLTCCTLKDTTFWHYSILDKRWAQFWITEPQTSAGSDSGSNYHRKRWDTGSLVYHRQAFEVILYHCTLDERLARFWITLPQTSIGSRSEMP